MLGNGGKRKLREIEVAKVFFTETFINIDINSASDIVIQKRLLEISQNNSSQSSLLAQRCLLCFISWQIEQVCLALEQQFGNFHGFTSQDLFGYVLDDNGSLEPSGTYRCIGREILETFDPDKSSLTTWTSRKVKQHRELNKYLLECGLYLVSDWAILNDTKPQQLSKILGEFHSLTDREIEQGQILLTAYHKIYRTERFMQRANQKTKGKCNPPTCEQLQAILEVLETQGINKLSMVGVMQKLQNLAKQLREYRIHVRNTSFPTMSLDAGLNENSSFIEQIPNTKENAIIDVDDANEIEHFLKNYRSQMVSCLDNAFKTVIESRLAKLKKKDTDKANQFITALQLFHCQRLSMSKIAQQLGLRAQDAVARLLKLKEFRADIYQETLIKLQDRVMELAEKYSTPTQLKILEVQITEALDEQVINIISQAELEASSMQSDCQISCFSERLCKQISGEWGVVSGE
jgi:hypothetical protein